MSRTTAAPQIEVNQSPGSPPIAGVAPGTDAVSWAQEHRDALRGGVARHGALLVRGLGLQDAEEVSSVFRVLGPELLEEREAFAARTSYGQGVYSSATWPANQPMCMHHELSYTRNAPGLMLFSCLTAADEGGATGVADARAVLEALPDDLVEKFERQGWMLIRNYNDEIGASVADAFGTDDREEVERYCAANRIEVQWQPDGGLRTRQRRAAVVRHPVSGERCWFNQVAFLSEWTMEPEVREFLVDMYGEEGLPFSTAFGDGEPIGEDVVAMLTEIYEAHTLREPWRAGDLMLVDNVRMAHSREPYQGEREVLVGMTDPVSVQDTFAGEDR